MNQEIKVKWLDALRSDEFKQGTGALKNDDAYCCLGVLCELHRREFDGVWVSGFSLPRYLDCSTYLPSVVQEWAGIRSWSPVAGDKSLAEVNDTGKTFQEIAELIEEHL
jgi:hypothetical protein